MKVLEINASDENYELRETEGISILDYSITEHLKDETFNKNVFNESNAFILSSGGFTGLGIPGAHRAIISGRSPLTKGFFFSTIGGLGEEIYRTSVDSIKITGRVKQPSVIVVKYEREELSVKIEPVKNLFKIYEENGVFSFQEYLVNEYSNFFNGLRYRSIVTGPAGFNTIMAGLSSVRVKDNELDYGSEGFAGRGGYGSLLAQAHNIAGIIIGGDYEKEENTGVNQRIINNYDESSIIEIAKSNTKKYRGKGTLLSNFESLETDTLMFNWNSLFWEESKRESYYKKYIKESYIKEYNIKESKTCGEVCPAVCKKVQKVHVKDYEPYSSCGPNLGIFTQEEAEEVVNAVDEMGFDAISFGNLLSTVFEALNKNIIQREELGISEEPVFEPGEFKLEDSKKNSRIAIKLIKATALGELPLLSKGVRFLSEEKNINFGVYFRFGSEGLISPNEYLRPGFITPLPILGKFTTFYKKGFFEPRELGRKSAERLIKELYNEDNGFCRFHRRWVEPVIPGMVNELLQDELDYYEHVKKVISKIIKYNEKSDSLPKKWVGRCKDLIHEHLKVSVGEFGETSVSKKWMSKFDEDYDKTILEYWNELVKGVEDVLGDEYGKALRG